MPKECIYVDGKCNKCTKIAFFPFIDRKFCFRHRKQKDPYRIISQNDDMKKECIPLIL